MLITANYVTNGQRVNVMIQNVNTVQTDQTNPVSAFRHWVNELWLDNCEEHLTYGEEPYKMKEYWDKYKYWLKREYKYQKAKNA